MFCAEPRGHPWSPSPHAGAHAAGGAATTSPCRPWSARRSHRCRRRFACARRHPQWPSQVVVLGVRPRHGSSTTPAGRRLLARVPALHRGARLAAFGAEAVDHLLLAPRPPPRGRGRQAAATRAVREEHPGELRIAAELIERRCRGAPVTWMKSLPAGAGLAPADPTPIPPRRQGAPPCAAAPEGTARGHLGPSRSRSRSTPSSVGCPGTTGAALGVGQRAARRQGRPNGQAKRRWKLKQVGTDGGVGTAALAAEFGLHLGGAGRAAGAARAWRLRSSAIRSTSSTTITAGACAPTRSVMRPSARPDISMTVTSGRQAGQAWNRRILPIPRGAVEQNAALECWPLASNRAGTTTPGKPHRSRCREQLVEQYDRPHHRGPGQKSQQRAVAAEAEHLELEADHLAPEHPDRWSATPDLSGRLRSAPLIAR